MTLRQSIVVAVAGTVVGIALVYGSTWLLKLLLPHVSHTISFLIWLPIQLVAFAIILAAILNFYATYMRDKWRRR
jgi:ABC-type lipoprotein release transport system permease subunit